MDLDTAVPERRRPEFQRSFDRKSAADKHIDEHNKTAKRNSVAERAIANAAKGYKSAAKSQRRNSHEEHIQTRIIQKLGCAEVGLQIALSVGDDFSRIVRQTKNGGHSIEGAVKAILELVNQPEEL